MNSIRFKLLTTLLVATSGLVICMYLVMQWSFDRGFLAYINAQEGPKYERLAEALSREWQQTGSWDRVKHDRRYWGEMFSSALGISLPPPQRSPGFANRARDSYSDRRPPPHFDPQGGNRFRPPATSQAPPRPEANDIPPSPTSMGTPRPFLLDHNKRVIYGQASQLDQVTLYPVSSGGTVVGYVGQLQKKELTGELDRVFLQQQTEAFSWITMVMILIPLLIVLPIAAQFVTPIKQLTQGTRKLTSGDYNTVIPVTSNDELGQLSKDFNTLAHTLAENEKSRQQWIADISHELRTPQAVLKGEIEAIQDGVRASSASAISSLHSEVEHLSQLVNDLYELSMSDIGALSYKKEKLYLGELLADCVEGFQRVFEQKGITILYTPSKEESYFCQADANRLKQLFSNLLKNTLRYTDAPGTLEIVEEVSSRHIALHFKDSAPGVPPDELSKLFQRLYRAEGSRNRALGGAGLGLSICQNIVKAHEGELSAKRSAMGGLWITVKLPLCT
ncbi:ATP-binding protein [Alkalimarinus coralli]|uniref:ATP-binding protein n=1 Tax=Alkalimarinus coralli TaxID=2935863 RepID=UPI00202B5732|nr:ATP-binding protein [Alkalimarinus coralli]